MVAWPAIHEERSTRRLGMAETLEQLRRRGIPGYELDLIEPARSASSAC